MQREIVIGAAIVIAAIATAATLVVQDARRLAVVTPTPAPTMAAPAPQSVAPQWHEASPPIIVAPEPVQTPKIVVAPTTAQAWTPAPQGRRAPAVADRPITEPVARNALSWVGADPAADEVYIAAINDPNLAPNQRKNLIEDLNETGFDNPRNLTQDDLPVIEYRMAMIEQLAPNAMDDVNAAAFQEAYKDLTNMRARIRGQ